MAKCVKCGLTTASRGHVELSDGAICAPCFKELGFRPTEAYKVKDYSFFDIKEGAEAFDLLAAKREK